MTAQATDEKGNSNPFLFWRDLANAATALLTGPSRKEQPAVVEQGQFTESECAEGAYRLFLPPASALPRSLVVMLHGCSQDPADFAAGTAMNVAASTAGFAVLYPSQSTQANSQRCWNWFQPAHQQRGKGEPALLAAITQKIIDLHGIDPRRVYVAGLSAGGAMAAVLGEAYPEIYAAVGVHSGLAARAATDLMTALKAMRGQGPVPNIQPSLVATIVFHGDADTTVDANNAAHIIQASTGSRAVIDHEVIAEGGRNSTRGLHRTADGQILAEQWIVHGAAHGWSGGSRKGSFTEECGPNASRQMLRFFAEHPRRVNAL
ncbi:MAG: Esterase, depolymerase [Chitinophagaceae bacterium]|nr:Esterase, depolymerase [Chitinophagaceae bacterium]